MKTGIVGLGCVGKAYAGIISNKEDVYVYDIRTPTENDLKEYPNWYYDLQDLRHCDILILCLPTPTDPDTEIVNVNAHHNVLQTLTDISYEGSVIIKSTITPDVLSELFNKFNKLSIGYSPEFLKEASAFEDLLTTDMHFVAGCNKAVEDYKNFIKRSKTESDECHEIDCYKKLSLMKYSINVFLATKVLFFNNMFDICNKEGVEYEELINLLSKDKRLGDSHMKVPGPDGSRGFGGMCFPKDTKAFKTYSKTLLKDSGMGELLDVVIKTNDKLR